jgi:hypothetical protein
MRDDLHRTVPLPRQWKPVLKYISRDADVSRVPGAIENAMRTAVRNGLEPKWANAFKTALMSAGDDFFGHDRLGRVFDTFERNNPTPLQRRICEIARALHARDIDTKSLYERSVAEACRQEVNRNIFHIEAQVREVHGPSEAGQVRRKLIEQSAKCDFENILSKRPRSKKISIDELLDQPIGK